MRVVEPHPHSLSPRGLAIAGWISLAVAIGTFITLAWQVQTLAPLVSLDTRISQWLHFHGTRPLTAALLVVTHVHSMIGMTLATAFFGFVLWRLQERYWLLTLLLAMAGGTALNVLLKVTYERARPVFEDPIVSHITYSFPSGHTAAATTFYGVLAAFLVSRTWSHGKRRAIVAAGVAMVALVAFSRVYLGAHYLSDVIAAACSSTVWLVACLSAVHGLVRRLRTPR
jgi:membrane-associated phospholipid phosphatase